MKIIKIRRKITEPLMAIQLPEEPSLEDIKLIKNFCKDNGFRVLGGNIVEGKRQGIQYQCFNHLEECWMNVPRGHFIVRGLFSEFYPIAPTALEKLYNIEVLDGE